MKKHLRIVEDHRASKWARFANFIIDRIVVYFIFFTFGAVSVLLFEVLNIEFFINITDQLATLSKFEDILITSSVYILYVFLMEYLAKGKTIGKYITGTKVISIDGTEPTIQDYFIRTISRLVPFDGLSFFGENGWHDSWSNTRVIDTKKYNAQLNIKTEIESLGNKEIA